MSKYDVRLSLLTDINCEYMYRLKFVFMQSVSNIFQVPNVTHLKYRVHLINVLWFSMSCLYIVIVSSLEFCNYMPHEGVYLPRNSNSVMSKEYNM